MLGRVLTWLTAKDNREAALAALTLVTALLGGFWFLHDRLFPPEGGDGPTRGAHSLEIGGDAGDVQQVAEGAVGVMAEAGAVVNLGGYTKEEHEAILARRESQLRSDLERAHTAEKALIQKQLDEVLRQMADVGASYEARKAELKRAMATLDEVAAGLPQAKLDAARRALGEGDTAKADALFAEVQAMEAQAIERAAAAAFERGKLAKSDIRWADAAGHFADAARLAPTYDHLYAARQTAWRRATIPLRFASPRILLKAAVAEHGERSAEHAAALNEEALTLVSMGRYGEAEPLFRDALTILEKTNGRAHPDYASGLNNLAMLLRIHGAVRRGRAALPGGAGDRREGARQGASRLRERAQQPRGASLGHGAVRRGRAAPPGGAGDPGEGARQGASGLRGGAQQPRGSAPGHGAVRRGRAALSGGAGDLGEDARQGTSDLRDRGQQPRGGSLGHGPARRSRAALPGVARDRGEDARQGASGLRPRAQQPRGAASGHGPERRGRAALREALAIGKGHPEYATWLNNLALVLQATGRFGEAEPLYREALQLAERTSGKSTFAYARNLQNLAVLLQATGREREAEPLAREAQAILRTVVGPAHPDYGLAVNLRATLLQAADRGGEAEPLYREALAILTAARGTDHPDTRTVAANLAALEAAQGGAGE